MRVCIIRLNKHVLQIKSNIVLTFSSISYINIRNHCPCRKTFFNKTGLMYSVDCRVEKVCSRIIESYVWLCIFELRMCGVGRHWK